MATLLAVALGAAARSGGATTPAQLVVTDIVGSAIALVDASSGTVGAPIPVAQWPGDVAITADGGTAYVTGSIAGAVVPVDLVTSTAGTAISVPCATNIALVPGRQKAYVTQSCDTTVTPVDLSTGTAGQPIEVGPAPFDVAVAPDSDTVYVTTGGVGSTPDALVPIEVDADAVGTPIPLGVGGRATSVAVTPDGQTAFVAMELDGTVTPVDLAAGTAGAPIAVSPHPVGLTLSADGGTLLVTHYALSPLGLGEPAPHDVTPIDVDTHAALPQIVLGSQTSGVAVTADGSTAYVSLVFDADPSQGSIVPIDIATGVTAAPIAVPGEPLALAIRPTGYVDTVPPTVQLEATPASPTGGGGTWFNSDDLPDGALTVTASASDPGTPGAAASGVAETTCVVDGVTLTTPGTQLTLPALGDGTHSVSCTARDNAGNVTDPPVEATYVVYTAVPEYRLVGLSPADGSTARAGQPLKIGVSLADANGVPALLCDGCAVELQTFAVYGSGEDAGPFPMRYHKGSGEYRTSWKPSIPGTTRIAVSVSYPGTTVKTTVTALVTVT